ncbi:tRNA (guanosine(37)-N1)-methyltransferase TrmD [Mangrovicoccus ximenensis]|uniref:tRNA (guanosine(37)-N1)-methyltransferase TrmD n=1 Tax=Mangrovicoccus ximenensis TaxID=1911570 RepID=UPI000D3A662F|nr:tRNA (guanosine(37)-N1)-methyltransferase TrmD [Mangrovicoccus ximenensis]
MVLTKRAGVIGAGFLAVLGLHAVISTIATFVLAVALAGAAGYLLRREGWRLRPVAEPVQEVLAPPADPDFADAVDELRKLAAGMVLRADVVSRALEVGMAGTPDDRSDWPLVYLSPRGRRFNQAMARRWSQARGITMLCGRFEGVDQRVLDAYDIEEVSLGDFVLTGGEIAAQAMLDATVRLLPGVLGNAASTEEESHSNGLLEHPQYTRPAEWAGREIPEVLLSGNHAKIAEWRRQQSEELTRARRPDLWQLHAGDGAKDG